MDIAFQTVLKTVVYAIIIPVANAFRDSVYLQQIHAFSVQSQTVQFAALPINALSAYLGLPSTIKHPANVEILSLIVNAIVQPTLPSFKVTVLIIVASMAA
jgi:hypothetical protein